MPPTLLGVLGLSQVVYVGGVMVKPPAVADLDNAITQLRTDGELLSDAINQGTDTDAAGKLLGTPATPPGVNARRQYNDQADRVEAMIESALEVEAVRSRLDWRPDGPTTAAVTVPVSASPQTPTSANPKPANPAVTTPAVTTPAAAANTPTPPDPATPTPAATNRRTAATPANWPRLHRRAEGDPGSEGLDPRRCRRPHDVAAVAVRRDVIEP